MKKTSKIMLTLALAGSLTPFNASAQATGGEANAVKHKSIASAVEAYWTRWRMRNSGVIDMGHLGRNSSGGNSVGNPPRQNPSVGNCNDVVVSGGNGSSGSLPKAQDNSNPEPNALLGSPYWTADRMRNARPMGLGSVDNPQDCLEKRRKRR